MEYKPLDPERDELRLVTIEDAATTGRFDRICCKLECFSLKDFLKKRSVFDRFRKGHDAKEKERPLFDTKAHKIRYNWGDYIALSYTWGDPKDTREIILNGHIRQVTASLEAALRDLCHMHLMCSMWCAKPRIWVDALCINQQDLNERNHEVQRMRSIFMNASHVIAWIGIGTDLSTSAMEFINNFYENSRIINMEKVSGGLMYDGSSSKILAKNQYDKLRLALHDLLSRPYWKRLWIIQEIAVRNPLILCGHNEAPLSNLYLTVSWLLENLVPDIAVQVDKNVMHGFDLSQIRAYDHVLGLSEFQSGGKKIELSRLMQISQGAQAADPRDKVYGTLGLMDDSISANIIPDYKLDVSAVYTTFISTVIEVNGLGILGLTELDVANGLPSWVPNFERPTRAYSFEVSRRRFYASEKIPSSVRFSEGSLTCSGIKFDILDGIGALSSTEQEYWRHREVYNLSVMMQAESGTNHYQTDEATENAIWQTLLAGRGLHDDDPPATYRHLLMPLIEETLGLLLPQDILDFVSCNSDFLLFGESLRDRIENFNPDTSANPEEMYQALGCVEKAIRGRRLCTTRAGYLALTPAVVRRGDLICVLFGCSTPMVLRRYGAGPYYLVGECYVHGIMYGEAMTRYVAGKQSAESFVLC